MGNIVILGAGPAGLGLAYKLIKENPEHKIAVIEVGAEVGGLARSFKFHDLWFDFGSHRLHPSCQPYILDDIKMLVDGNILKRKRNGRILLDGKFIKFPLFPFDLLRNSSLGFKAGILRDNTFGKIGHMFDKFDEANPAFKDFMYHKLGKTICEKFYFPYLKKITGLPLEEIHSIQAKKRIANNSLGKLIKKVSGNLFNSKNENKNFFYYFENGYGQFINKYAEKIVEMGGRILTNSYAKTIRKKNNKYQVEIIQQQGILNLEADIIFSTIPITKTVSLIDDKGSHNFDLSYRSMLLVYLVINRPSFTSFDAHYLPEEKYFISRISEPRNYSLASEPAEKTGVCFEIPTEKDSDLAKMEDDNLIKLIREQLKIANLPYEFEIIAFKKILINNAYPQYKLNFMDVVSELKTKLLDFGNIISLGRQGLFVHDNTHHALEMAYAAADCYNGEWDHARWEENLKQFEKNVVED